MARARRKPAAKSTAGVLREFDEQLGDFRITEVGALALPVREVGPMQLGIGAVQPLIECVEQALEAVCIEQIRILEALDAEVEVARSLAGDDFR